jgi:hypothetical protein
LPADQLFQFGDPNLILVGLAILLEQSVQAFEDGRFPLGKELRLEGVLATEIGLAGRAAEKFKDELGFEIGWEGTTLTAWHGKPPG